MRLAWLPGRYLPHQCWLLRYRRAPRAAVGEPPLPARLAPSYWLAGCRSIDRARAVCDSMWVEMSVCDTPHPIDRSKPRCSPFCVVCCCFNHTQQPALLGYRPPLLAYEPGSTASIDPIENQDRGHGRGRLWPPGGLGLGIGPRPESPIAARICAGWCLARLAWHLGISCASDSGSFTSPHTALRQERPKPLGPRGCVCLASSV